MVNGQQDGDVGERLVRPPGGSPAVMGSSEVAVSLSVTVNGSRWTTSKKAALSAAVPCSTVATSR